MTYTPPNDFMIGYFADGPTGMTLMSNLLNEGNVPFVPNVSFTTFSGQQDMLDTSRLGTGYSMCEMDQEFLSDTQRYKLRQYCPDALSNQVYIRVPTNETNSDGTHIFHTFLATMLWHTGSETRTIFITDQDPGIFEKPKIVWRALQQQD